jgi:predicted O-methyltransferase YrrM
MLITETSKNIVESISTKVKTFHHHYHLLYDIANLFDSPTYLEIGAYAGGSAILMLKNENVKRVISIDLGTPISEKELINNVKNNVGERIRDYKYIKGNSSSSKVVSEVNQLTVNDGLDILFIDGDHTYNGVKNDFMNYNDLVNEGGFIVFDDYHCKISPDVKLFVNELIKSESFQEKYDVIGCVENTYGAKPKELKTSNEFIIRKKNK